MLSGKQRGSRDTLIKLVYSLIVPRLLYGFSFAGRRRDKVLPIISPIYNKAIRLASGAFPTSPIKAIMCEAGQLPFEYLANLNEAKTCSRLLEMERTSENLPVIQRTKVWFSMITNTDFPKITRIWRTGPPRWDHHPLKVDWYLQRKVKAGDCSGKVMTYYKELVSEKYSEHYKIFTDGSKCQRHTGFGIYSKNDEICGRINDDCSVYSAEIMAVCTAIRNVKKKCKTVIFSDSASTLKALETGKSKNSWIQACENACENKDIVFVWIPGHSGIAGNEAADALANEGRSSELIYEKLTRQDANRLIKRKIWEAWQLEWSSSNPGTQLNKIKQNVWKWHDRSNQYEQKVLSRMRIGHSKLTHSYLLSYQDAPRCSKCYDVLTVKHILVDCSNLAKLRKVHKISGNLENILKNDEKREDALIKFVKEVDLFKLM